MKTGWTAADIPRQDGTWALVTGANRGLGYHAALELARAGAEVVIASRDPASGATACANVRAEVPGAKVSHEPLDLASLDSVRDFAARIQAAKRPVNLLMNNAGVMAIPTRQLTRDGFERQFATNHLGHFALTSLLLPRLAANARVVTISSSLASFGAIDFENLQGERKYSADGAYAMSKLANQLFFLELQRRVPAGIVSVGAHPGIASTGIAQSGPSVWIAKMLAQSPRTGALPQLFAATSPDVTGGDYFGPGGLFGISGAPAKAKVAKRALDPELAKKLWERSRALTGT